MDERGVCVITGEGAYGEVVVCVATSIRVGGRVEVESRRREAR